MLMRYDDLFTDVQTDFSFFFLTIHPLWRHGWPIFVNSARWNCSEMMVGIWLGSPRCRIPNRAYIRLLYVRGVEIVRSITREGVSARIAENDTAEAGIITASDNLSANRHDCQAFAHGCNRVGVMGAGIALQFRMRYPRMYRQYRALCLDRSQAFELGEVFFWDEDTPYVFNLSTQERPGVRADKRAIQMAAERMKFIAKRNDIESIAIPRIGAGLGKLEWADVRGIFLAVFRDWVGRLVVYEG